MAAEPNVDFMSVTEVMQNWPSTIRVFLDHRMLCVGCPVSRFHTLADSAREHGVVETKFRQQISLAIHTEKTTM